MQTHDVSRTNNCGVLVGHREAMFSHVVSQTQINQQFDTYCSGNLSDYLVHVNQENIDLANEAEKGSFLVSTTIICMWSFHLRCLYIFASSSIYAL